MGTNKHLTSVKQFVSNLTIEMERWICDLEILN